MWSYPATRNVQVASKLSDEVIFVKDRDVDFSTQGAVSATAGSYEALLKC